MIFGFMGSNIVSGSSQSKPYFAWIWKEILSPAYLKALDVFGPKVLIVVTVVLVIPETSDTVHSVADWLNLAYEAVESYRDNNNAGTEFING